MVAIAEESLAPYVPPEKAGFRRYIAREPLGLVLVIAPWNYPYLTAVNTIVPALLAGNAVHPQACLADAARRRALRRPPSRRRACRRASSRTSSSATRRPRRLIGSGKINHINFTGSVAGGKADRARRRRHLRLARPRARRQGPGLCPADAKLDHAIENLVDGGFYNSGQCCCGIERIYVA